MQPYAREPLAEKSRTGKGTPSSLRFEIKIGTENNDHFKICIKYQMIQCPNTIIGHKTFKSYFGTCMHKDLNKYKFQIGLLKVYCFCRKCRSGSFVVLDNPL